MWKIIPFLVIFLIRSLSASLSSDSTFFPWRLEREQDCRAFNSSPHTVARINGYYSKGKWFMDAEMKISFLNCVDLISQKELEARYMIYKIQNMFDYSDKVFLDAIEDLIDEIPNYMSFIPEINFVLGPNGDPKTLAKNLHSLRGAAVLSVAEKQQTNIAYTNEFFIDYYQIQNLRDTYKYIQLNGWHLRNMMDNPDMKIARLVEAIIIYVEPENSHRIGLNQINRHMVDIYTTVIYDMHDAMKYLAFDSSNRIRGEVSLWILLLMGILFGNNKYFVFYGFCNGRFGDVGIWEGDGLGLIVKKARVSSLNLRERMNLHSFCHDGNGKWEILVVF